MRDGNEPEEVVNHVQGMWQIWIYHQFLVDVIKLIMVFVSNTYS